MIVSINFPACGSNSSYTCDKTVAFRSCSWLGKQQASSCILMRLATYVSDLRCAHVLTSPRFWCRFFVFLFFCVNFWSLDVYLYCEIWCCFWVCSRNKTFLLHQMYLVAKCMMDKVNSELLTKRFLVLYRIEVSIALRESVERKFQYYGETHV